MAKASSDEFVEKKSRFIATVIPVENEEEALEFIEKTKKKYQLGDKVRIKVLKCDKIKKTIDFSLIDGNIEGVEKSGETTRDEADSQ